MTNKQALEYWKFKYSCAKDYWDDHWEAEERHRHQSYVKALEAAIVALEKVESTVDTATIIQSGWVSVKDRMPENDKSVLICACGHRVTAYYNHLKKAFILTENEKLYYETAAVSHWMPLPEPPKEVQDDA